MKCTLNPAIANMSGKCGDMLFKTYTKADGKKETRAYMLPVKGWNNRTGKPTYGYKRTSKLSEKEVAARERFSKASQIFKNLTKEEYMRYYHQWRAARHILHGKEYNTLRGYVIARLYDEKVV